MKIPAIPRILRIQCHQAIVMLPLMPRQGHHLSEVNLIFFYNVQSSSHWLRVSGYTSEASLSRSMSGPPGPSILPSSAYGGFRDAEREVARQRRRNIHESRRQSKLLMRRAMLPSTPGIRPSEVDYLSGSIDSFVAHSGSSYDNHGAYVRTPTATSGHGGYGTTLSA